MKRLNLLPKDHNPAATVQSSKGIPPLVIIKIVIGAVVALLIFNGYQLFTAMQMEGKVSAVTKKIENLERTQKKKAKKSDNAHEKEEHVDTIKERNEFLKKQKNSRLSYSRILIVLGLTVPDNLRVNKIDLNNKGILLDGSAANYALVGQMMQRMVKTRYFIKPELKFTHKSDDPKSDLIGYEVYSAIIPERLLSKNYE